MLAPWTAVHAGRRKSLISSASTRIRTFSISLRSQMIERPITQETRYPPTRSSAGRCDGDSAASICKIVEGQPFDGSIGFTKALGTPHSASRSCRRPRRPNLPSQDASRHRHRRSCIRVGTRRRRRFRQSTRGSRCAAMMLAVLEQACLPRNSRSVVASPASRAGQGHREPGRGPHRSSPVRLRN